jgi:hypothetical protein
MRVCGRVERLQGSVPAGNTAHRIKQFLKYPDVVRGKQNCNNELSGWSSIAIQDLNVLLAPRRPAARLSESTQILARDQVNRSLR